MNYIDFIPKSFFLFTYLGYGLLLLFLVNKCRIILSTEKGGRWYVQSLNIMSDKKIGIKKPTLAGMKTKIEGMGGQIQGF